MNLDREQDDGAPTARTLAYRHRTCRRPHRAGCGHDLARGDTYTEWVGLIDGEFTRHVECRQCHDEMDDTLLEER